MKKLNPTIYFKLLIQAAEAQHQGLTALAEDVNQAVGDEPADELEEYSFAQLEEDIRKDMWKLATNVMYYYNLDNVDIEKLEGILSSRASNFIEELSEELNTSITNTTEPKLPGESN